jgi:UDP-3-O-[3-hydroxymyristoyl] glucosamine N-acyltransferase
MVIIICRLGDYVVLAGKVGVADHVSIVSKVLIIEH